MLRIMDRTAPTILPLNLNHVLGTDAAPFSVDVRSADQISADLSIIVSNIRKALMNVCAMVRSVSL